jgi:hypothetical protein
MLLAHFLEEILCFVWNQEVLYHFLQNPAGGLNPEPFESNPYSFNRGAHILRICSPWQLNFAWC